MIQIFGTKKCHNTKKARRKSGFLVYMEISLAMFPEYRQKHFAKRLLCMAGMCAKKAAILFLHIFTFACKNSRAGAGGREGDC